MATTQVTLNKAVNSNPFAGMRATRTLFQSLTKADSINDVLLNEAYAECDTHEKKELFWSLAFAVGDITSRQHNIFHGKTKDNGGNSNREGFAKILRWTWKNHRNQFVQFLHQHLFEEFTCFDHLLVNRVQTSKNNVVAVKTVFDDPEYRKTIVNYLAMVIRGKDSSAKMSLAKFLSLPRLAPRKGHKKMLDETKQLMSYKIQVLKALSDEMGWDYKVNGSYINFKGYREWRKELIQNLESVLFSTGRIKGFDKETFFKWLEALPAQARFRVKNRVLYSEVVVFDLETGGLSKENYETNAEDIKPTKISKYPQLKEWYLEWEKHKENKQKEQRVLEEKVRQGQASDADKIRLEKVKKAAKVNVGATSFADIYQDIKCDNIDELKVESFLNKVNLPYNSLVIIDSSGSMKGEAFNLATFLAAVCLYKNPDDAGRNLLGMFDEDSRWYGCIDKEVALAPNSIYRMTGMVNRVAPRPFIDPMKSFIENYTDFKKFVYTEGPRCACTHISQIPEGLHDAVRRDPSLLDTLKNFPIWTIISDYEWNNMRTPAESMKQFMDKCEEYFGYRPFIVAIDANRNCIYGRGDTNEDLYTIENVIYIPDNPGLIEQFLVNFKDMDTYDAYAPLQSMYRSNRYELIRQNVI